jgi:hypothetical protein
MAVTMKNAIFWDIETQFVPHKKLITCPLHQKLMLPVFFFFPSIDLVIVITFTLDLTMCYKNICYYLKALSITEMENELLCTLLKSLKPL